MVDYRESERMVQRLANKVMFRLSAAGAPTHIKQDIQQEMWVAWCLARDGWDETKGASFATYAYTGMLRHINRWAEVNVSKRHAEVIALSLDATVDPEGEGGTLAEAIPADQADVDEEMTEASDWRLVMRYLDPTSRKFLTLLRDQPPELLAEVRALQARAQYARDNGYNTFVASGLSTMMISDLMGLNKVERLRIAKRIRKAGEKFKERTAA